MNKEFVKKAALDCGFDIVGIAGLNRIRELPGSDEFFISMPQAKSAIVLGSQILRGAIRGTETGSSYNCQTVSATVIAGEAYDFSKLLEQKGNDALICSYYDDKLLMLAHAAGLGVIGKGGFFITPEYGIRQVLTVVLTDLELESDELCRENFCLDCTECIDACYLNALCKDTTETLCGQERNKLLLEKCAICKTGIRGDGTIGRITAACGRACVAKLEDSFRVSRALKKPFGNK